MSGWQQAGEYWQGLQPRERTMLLFGGLALLIALVYFLVWQPIMSARTEIKQEVQQKLALLHWINDASSEAKSLRGTTGQGGKTKDPGGKSLLSLVDQTAKQQGLGSVMKRVEPDGKQVRVWFEAASFDQLVVWLEKLSSENGVYPDSMTVERSRAAGLVDARLRLAEGST